MSDDRIAYTAAAVARGEHPYCPLCGEEFDLKTPRRIHWMCDSVMRLDGEEFRQSDLCRKAEMQDLHKLLEKALTRLFHYDLRDPVGDEINVFLHPQLPRCGSEKVTR